VAQSHEVRSGATQPVGAESYYGRPILKEPTWTWEGPLYLFAGGIAGGAAALGAGARLAGDDELARRAVLVNLAAIAVSPALLISDLGRPDRFLNMLRVVKPTSPMSVGTWVLSASCLATGAAGACELRGILPRVRAAGTAAAGLLAPFLATYTAVLVSNTAVPVWHEARRELPFVFAGSAAASAGAAIAIATPVRSAAPARRLAVAGAALELAATEVMERRLGFVGEPYHEGAAGRLSRLAKALTASGAVVTALAGRRRAGAIAGGALLLGGGLAERWAVYKAGFQSVRDPRYVVQPQRARVLGSSEDRRRAEGLAGDPSSRR
jgi:formate-dependent nitrite reductase membrane component NrfD